MSVHCGHTRLRGRVDRRQMSWGNVSLRTAWIFLAACLLFEAVSVTVLCAGDVSASMNLDPHRLITTGARGADLTRLRSLLDMFGYLAAIPVVLYLASRFRGEPGIDFFTLSGILFVVMGALAAIIFAFAVAPLIREYATSPTARDAIEPTFVALYRIAVFGIWQTLNGILAGIWAMGVGRLAWQERARALPRGVFGAGLFNAGGAPATIAGIFPGS